MNERILMVDDEPEILETLRRVLAESNYHMECASTGREGLALLRSRPFDLVITDVRMPGMDGLSFMRRIKEMDQDIQVIILTGFGNMKGAIEALRDDRAFDYLTKPLEDISRLENTVAQALQKRKLRRENQELCQALARGKTELEHQVLERTRELVGAKEEAEAASLAKSEFLGAMSHELRTPLNAVIGFSEVLMAQYFGKLNPRQMAYVGDILESGKHLLTMIDHILDLVSLEENGETALEQGAVHVRDLLEESLNMVKENAFKRAISLTLNISENLEGTEVWVNKRSIRQMVYHLLSNAVKFTPDHGEIRVTAGIVDWRLLIGDENISRKDAKTQREIEALQSPITNHQSPINNHQSPITNHQSPITNHQSPINNRQSTINNHQSHPPGGG